MGNNVFFIGCLHLSHENMAKHRGFYDSWEHDEHLIRCWNSVVNHTSKVFILGDITMENARHYPKLDELNGSKHVILGNHDRPQDIHELFKYVSKISGMYDYKGYTLTHAPIHPNEVVWYKGNIHAHIHHVNKLEECLVSNKYKDEGWSQTDSLHKYINVDAHLIGYKPLSFEQIKAMKNE